MATFNDLSSHLMQRASSLWTYLSSDFGPNRHEAVDGEVIFSKNNICVHSDAGQHVPGYFTIKVHKFLPFSEDGDPHEESTLILNWVPNNFIQKHPKSISPESSPTKSHVQVSIPFGLFFCSTSLLSQCRPSGSLRLRIAKSL